MGKYGGLNYGCIEASCRASKQSCYIGDGNMGQEFPREAWPKQWILEGEMVAEIWEDLKMSWPRPCCSCPRALVSPVLGGPHTEDHRKGDGFLDNYSNLRVFFLT